MEPAQGLGPRACRSPPPGVGSGERGGCGYTLRLCAMGSAAAAGMEPLRCAALHCARLLRPAPRPLETRWEGSAASFRDPVWLPLLLSY